MKIDIIPARLNNSVFFVFMLYFFVAFFSAFVTIEVDASSSSSSAATVRRCMQERDTAFKNGSGDMRRTVEAVRCLIDNTPALSPLHLSSLHARGMLESLLCDYADEAARDNGNANADDDHDDGSSSPASPRCRAAEEAFEAASELALRRYVRMREASGARRRAHRKRSSRADTAVCDMRTARLYVGGGEWARHPRVETVAEPAPGLFVQRLTGPFAVRGNDGLVTFPASCSLLSSSSSSSSCSNSGVVDAADADTDGRSSDAEQKKHHHEHCSVLSPSADFFLNVAKNLWPPRRSASAPETEHDEVNDDHKDNYRGYDDGGGEWSSSYSAARDAAEYDAQLDFHRSLSSSSSSSASDKQLPLPVAPTVLVSALGHATSMYYHWLCEALPRLVVASLHLPDATWQGAAVLLHAQLLSKQFVADSVDMLFVGADDDTDCHDETTDHGGGSSPATRLLRLRMIAHEYHPPLAVFSQPSVELVAVNWAGEAAATQGLPHPEALRLTRQEIIRALPRSSPSSLSSSLSPLSPRVVQVLFVSRGRHLQDAAAGTEERDTLAAADDQQAQHQCQHKHMRRLDDENELIAALRQRQGEEVLTTKHDGGHASVVINVSVIDPGGVAPQAATPTTTTGGGGGSSSFKTVMSVFHDADVVVGVHGGALANIIACGPGSAVVEIGFATAVARQYEHLARALALSYVRVEVAPDLPQRRSLTAPVIRVDHEHVIAAVFESAREVLKSRKKSNKEEKVSARNNSDL